jgi:GT2 family glycosyltransferase
VAVSNPPASASVTVIIPARNAASYLSRCLAALSREHVPGATARLIVVDDASEDDTAQVAAAAGALVVRGDGRGPAAARNLGAAYANTEFLLFLDADTAPEPGWLKMMLEPFADSDIAAVKGRYVTVQRAVMPRFAQVEFEEKYARLERAQRIDFVDTGTAAYRRDVFVDAGGFDEAFPSQSAEDVELAFRLAAHGARFAFAPGARVLHAHADSLRAYLKKKARYGFFRAVVYRRYPTKLKGDSYTPPWMGLQIVGAGVIPLALLGRFAGLARWPLGVSLAGFGLTCWPLIHRAWTTDRPLVPWVMPLSYLRACAQGLGLTIGLVASVARDLGPPRSGTRGGEGGIRTHEGLHLTRFPGERHKPD